MIFFTFVRVITHLLIPSITDIVVEEKGVVKRRTTLNLEKVEDRIFFQTLNNVPVDCKTLHLEFTIGKGTNEEKKYFAKRNLQMTIITLKACEHKAPLITRTVHYYCETRNNHETSSLSTKIFKWGKLRNPLIKSATTTLYL